MFDLSFFDGGAYQIYIWIGVGVLVATAVAALVVGLLRSSARREARFLRSVRGVCLQVLVPRQFDEAGRSADLKMVHDQIAITESIFANLGNLKAETGFQTWWRGRMDQISLEIVAHKKLIYFYWVVPAEWQLFVEEQIHSQYPAADIIEMEDYNLFSPNGYAVGSEVTISQDSVFPIKTYNTTDGDPMNTILTALSRFGEDEAGAIQLVIRPTSQEWSKRAKKIARKVSEGLSFEQALTQSGVSSFNIGNMTLSAYNNVGFAVNQVIGSAMGGVDTTKKEDERKPLTPQEQEMLKGIEQKATKAGLGVTIRLVTAAANKEVADRNLENLQNAFGSFNVYQYGNSFKIIKGKQDAALDSFIFRDFSESRKMILNTEELASLFHMPNTATDVPNVVWLISKKAAAPTNMPVDGITLGFNEYRGRRVEVRIREKDRLRHIYAIGKSGVGKSTLFQNMAIQDVIEGRGVCVMDPHGDLVDDVLNNIPKSRAEDVIYFDPANLDRPMGLNMLEYDERYPEQKTFAVNEMLKIFDRLYDLKATGGPMFEYYVRNAMLLLMDSPETGSTIMEIPKILADDNFRNMKLRACKNQEVKDFWVKQALKAGGEGSLANMVPYIASKFASFITNDYMRVIVGQQQSAFNFRKIMDEGKILLLKMSKGRVGDLNAYLLGMIMVGKILMAAMSRTDLDERSRKPFYFYIDEFQNFTTDSINAILSEARKYGLGLNIAHQYMGQLSMHGDTSIRDAVIGNVGTMICYRIGSDDAEFLEKDFTPVFNKFDLMNVPFATAYVKLLIDGTASKPFNMRAYPPRPSNKKLGALIAQLSSLKYGKDRRLIEEEIRLRGLSAMMPEPKEAEADAFKDL